MAEILKALRDGHWLDFVHNDEPKCPHCGDRFDISENEAWRIYDEDDVHTIECQSCDTAFTVRAHCAWTFSTDRQEDEYGLPLPGEGEG